MPLTAIEQELLNHVYRSFRDTGKWPLVWAVERDLNETLEAAGGLETVCEGIGAEFLSWGALDQRGSDIKVTLPGLELVPEAADDIAAFLKLCRQAADVAWAADTDQMRLTYSEFAAHNNLGEQQARRAFELSSYGGFWDSRSSAEITLNRFAMKLRNVRDLKDFFLRKQEYDDRGLKRAHSYSNALSGRARHSSWVVPSSDATKVFVVHGRNDAIRRDVFNLLRALGLNPIEWSEAVQLTGKASPYVGEILDHAFSTAQAIVVILTPDDEVRLSPSMLAPSDDASEREFRKQSRPNVLFEAGMAFGRQPDRTILVEIGAIKPFSDVGGRHTVRLSNDPERRHDLAERLRSAGCAVKMTGSDWLKIGDFQIDRDTH